MRTTTPRDAQSVDAATVKPARRGSAAAHAACGAEEERERVRQILHDGLGQLLTSISFLAGSLQQKLAARDLPEAAEAKDIIALTQQAIAETQRLVPDAGPRNL